MRQVASSSFRPASFGASLPAPVGGWNARDPIASMPPTDAIFLDNFFPRPGDVILRKGSSQYATLPTGRIRSLLPYNKADGTTKFFAADDSGLYDVTNGGTVSVVASAATNGAWESVNISTAGGHFLWCCNGVDKSRYYNGTTWTVLDGGSSPALTGITSENITHVSLHKSRLYLVGKNSLSFWYLPVNSVAGAAAEFPLGAIFRHGGYLVATGSWTLDGGNGPEDYFVAVTSEGEVAIYSGIDPSNAATWALQGVYMIGRPIGRRCLINFGGDLLLLTVRGLFPLSKALQSATVDVRSAVSDKILNAWTEYADAYKGLFGWQPILCPELSSLWVNVPIRYDAANGVIDGYQFVLNTQTGSWCRFTGMSAECWAYREGRLYFARHNKVYLAWEGGSDVDGAPIQAAVKTAFLYPAGRGNTAQVKLVKPIFSTNGSGVNFQLGIDHDYTQNELSSGQVTYLQDGSFWDQATWDQSYWENNDFNLSTLIAQWKSISHYPGRALALRLRLSSKGVSMAWTATDFVLQKGGMM